MLSQKASIKWRILSYKRKSTFTALNLWEEDLEYPLSFSLLKIISIWNPRELLTPANPLPEDVLLWLPSRVLSSEWQTILLTKNHTTTSSFVGILLKVRSILVWTHLSIHRSKLKIFTKLELRFHQVKQLNFQENKLYRSSLNTSLQWTDSINISVISWQSLKIQKNRPSEYPLRSNLPKMVL